MAAVSNDIFGAKAFEQLDKSMVKHYKQHYVLPYTGEVRNPCEDLNQ